MSDEIKAIIQLDKLVMCCRSVVNDNFNDECINRFYSDAAYTNTFVFGSTTLVLTTDFSKRFRFSYNVFCGSYFMGKIHFGLLGQSYRNDKVWFYVNNQVFYNDTLHFLPTVFSDLNLTLNNITRLEIALDCYDFNFEQILRRSIRNKENRVKLFGRYIARKEFAKRIRFWNYGTLDNPFKVRTIYIKNKRKIHYSKQNENEKEDCPSNKKGDSKTTIELAAYNKSDEIDDFSPHKKYIRDNHVSYNSKFENIYRLEVRLESEELSRYVEKYVKKHNKTVELSDLLNKQFLFDVFTEYIDRIIVIKDRNNNKIDLFPKPCLGSCEGKLPLPLPEAILQPRPVKNKEMIFNNDIIIKGHFQNVFSINHINKTISYEKRQEIIGSHQTENQSIYARSQESQFWEAAIFNP